MGGLLPLGSKGRPEYRTLTGRCQISARQISPRAARAVARPPGPLPLAPGAASGYPRSSLPPFRRDRAAMKRAAPAYFLMLLLAFSALNDVCAAATPDTSDDVTAAEDNEYLPCACRPDTGPAGVSD